MNPKHELKIVGYKYNDEYSLDSTWFTVESTVSINIPSLTKTCLTDHAEASRIIAELESRVASLLIVRDAARKLIGFKVDRVAELGAKLAASDENNKRLADLVKYMEEND